MTTLMYEDADGVDEKGYAAVSHVWGDQQMYSVDELGINGGVEWKVPLSDPNKIHRLVDAMNHHGMEYCWWDVLCMPQGKQDEINLEIPFMGDYYSGADITFVLSDSEYIIPDKYETWCSIVSDVMQSGAGFTPRQQRWMQSNQDLIDFSKDPWFTRVWTFQETVFSKKLILLGVNGVRLNLSDLLDKLEYLDGDNISYIFGTFDKCPFLINASRVSRGYRNKELDLVRVVGANAWRECHKIHDRFYATLGMLGYRDFVVDYDIDIDDLNKHIIRHAYSRGDLSWMYVGGDVGTSFIQPMYEPFLVVASRWKQDPSSIVLHDTLHVQSEAFGIVVCHEKYTGSPTNIDEIISWTTQIFMSWGFSLEQIFDSMIQYDDIPAESTLIGTCLIEAIAKGTKWEDTAPELFQLLSTLDLFVYGCAVGKCFTKALLKGVKWGNVVHEMLQSMPLPEKFKHLSTVANRLMALSATYPMVTIVKVVAQEHSYPLIVCGNAAKGDVVAMTKACDDVKSRKGLGIIVSTSSERRGVCVVPRNTTEKTVRTYEFAI